MFTNLILAVRNRVLVVRTEKRVAGAVTFRVASHTLRVDLDIAQDALHRLVGVYLGCCSARNAPSKVVSADERSFSTVDPALDGRGSAIGGAVTARSPCVLLVGAIAPARQAPPADAPAFLVAASTTSARRARGSAAAPLREHLLTVVVCVT